MDCRRIEINLISASDLEDVREIFRMKVYAVVSNADNKETERRLPSTSKTRSTLPGTAPSNTPSVSSAVSRRVMLVVKLYCKRKLGDRYIGEVHTSIKELYDQGQANGGGGGATLTYKVQKGSAVSQGELRLSCMFSEKVIIKEEASGKKRPKKGKVIFLRAISSLCIPLVLGCDDDDDYVVDYASQS